MKCWISFVGVETFKGKCYHSWEYRDPDALKGKRAVVVGIGNSGGDIAVEISRAAQKVRKPFAACCYTVQITV